MRPKHSGQPKPSAEGVVKDIRHATRRHFSAEEQLKRSGLAPMVLAILSEVQNIADDTWDENFPEIEKIGISKRQFSPAFLNGLKWKIQDHEGHSNGMALSEQV